MKTMFITGAAGGIGLATARHFSRLGWFVGLYGINAGAVGELLQSGEFPRACGGHCDVTCRESIGEALDAFSQATDGRLDVLVNNAGVLWSGSAEEIDSAHNHAMIDINVKGLTDVAMLGFPLLAATPGACLVNLCSLSSVYGVPRLAIYSATKFYVRGLSEALNIEWEEHDIHVVSIKPPYIQTAMLGNVDEGMMQTIKPEYGPEDVAATIQEAVQSNRVSQIMGWKGNLMNVALRLLPEALSRRLMIRVMNAA